MSIVGGMGDFNETYFDAVESSPGATDLTGVQPVVVEAANEIGKGYYEATGNKIIITGGSESGGPHVSEGEYTHSKGWKLDLSTSDSSGGAVDEELLGKLCDEQGVAAAREDSAHYDLAFGPTNAGYGVNYITQTQKGQLGGDGGGAAAKKKVQALIEWCINTANSPGIGYATGAGGPDSYDCTGFISAGMQAAGFDITVCHGSAFDTAVVAAGWKKIEYDDSQGTDPLKPGDILSNDHHVELYIGDGNVVGAHTNKEPLENQVSVEGYYPNNWECIYRCVGGGGPAGGGNNPRGPYNGKNSIAKKEGNKWVAMPKNKTPCEPVYPDLMYVAGNIPNSAVEKTAVNNTGGMQKDKNNLGLMTNANMEKLTGLNTGGFTTDRSQKLAQRQYDPSKQISEVKVPSGGKPLNNNDPYPVDLKIEEIENHLPRVKKYEEPFDPKISCTSQHAKDIVELSDAAEKRIVKLENTLATVMRYVFGMGSRVFINCQYFGGQDQRSKYSCIRCLNDSLTTDGQVMSIDQCLSCSRYEPVVGQTYEMLGETGANLAVVQDDMQKSYSNMEEFLELCRIEKMHKPKTTMQISYQDQKERNTNETDFKDIWDEGVKMDWNLVPVETQKAQINWRADINSEDKSPKKLASNQNGNSTVGSGVQPGCTLKPGEYANIVSKHLSDMLDKIKGTDEGKDINKSFGK